METPCPQVAHAVTYRVNNQPRRLAIQHNTRDYMWLSTFCRVLEGFRVSKCWFQPYFGGD
jgi:hypothetical protein